MSKKTESRKLISKKPNCDSLISSVPKIFKKINNEKTTKNRKIIKDVKKLISKIEKIEYLPLQTQK